jgi:hypothetical protein
MTATVSILSTEDIGRIIDDVLRKVECAILRGVWHGPEGTAAIDDRIDLLRTALHEAGHATVDAMIGLGVRLVSIRSNGSLQVGEVTHQWKKAGTVTEVVPTADAGCSMYMAGIVAECMAGFPLRPTFNGKLWLHDDGGNSDVEQIHRWLQKVVPEDRGLALKDEWRLTHRLLKREWASVNLLARLLVIRGELQGPELAGLLPSPLSAEELAQVNMDAQLSECKEQQPARPAGVES